MIFYCRPSPIFRIIIKKAVSKLVTVAIGEVDVCQRYLDSQLDPADEDIVGEFIHFLHLEQLIVFKIWLELTLESKRHPD